MGERGRFMVNRTVYDAYEKKLFDNDSEKTSDQEVEALFSEIISILPNNGILYKYKSIEGFHVDELSEKYLWFSSAKHLNDNKDCAFNVNLLEDTEKIVHYFLKDDKFRKFLVDGAYKELSQKDPGLTKKDVVDCLECISKNGIKIGKLKFNKFCKDHKLSQEQKITLSDTIAKYGDDKQNEKTIRDSISGLNSLTERIRDGIMVFSLTTSYKKDSMWAYYCGNRGICIEYDFKKVHDLNLKKKFINIFRIKYRKKKKFSYVKILEANIANDKEGLLDADKMLFEQLSIKDKSWATEEEWRIIQNMQNENRVGVKVFADIISALYIDYSVMQEEKTKQIIELAEKNEWRIYIRYFSPIESEYKYKTIEETNNLIKKMWQINH